MKWNKVLAMVASAVMLTAIWTANAWASPTDKVEVCHINAANEPVSAWGGWVRFGRVIEVDEAALDAHFAHADSADFDTDVDQVIEFFGAFGVEVVLTNANCWYYEQPE